ncbi:hypothetical protein ACLKA6_010358 [Drosophila palustris]
MEGHLKEGGGALLVLGIDEMAKNNIKGTAGPAGPSDSLEDLAEDEDLAQMAMSSQELHEELEGADVALPPCDDEGNSRPPSSCDMEPLL